MADFKPPNRNLLSRLFNNNHEMIKKFESLYSNNNELAEIVDRLQEEVDRIEAGAGLDENGNYIPPTGTNYIDGSTSLANADVLLDEAIGNNLEKIISITVDYSAQDENQLILADATSGEINVTLPNPSVFFANNVSKKIGITKIDTSPNFVNMLPFASETIVGETNQRLRYKGEVLNFITDGANWYLGA